MSTEDFKKFSYVELKKRVPAYKGHLTRAKTRLENAIVRKDKDHALEFCHIFNDKVDVLVAIVEALELSVLDVDPANLEQEQDFVLKLSEEIMTCESKVNDRVSKLKSENSNDTSIPGKSKVADASPSIKMAGMQPSPWNGNKAEFYSWQSRFNKLMIKAKIIDDQVQLSWLLRDGMIPDEYKAFVRDCNNVTAAWERLEE